MLYDTVVPFEQAKDAHQFDLVNSTISQCFAARIDLSLSSIDHQLLEFESIHFVTHGQRVLIIIDLRMLMFDV